MLHHNEFQAHQTTFLLNMGSSADVLLKRIFAARALFELGLQGT
jgi:hypothetical protein